MDHFRLSQYEIQAAGNSQILVLVNGNLIYKTILTRAFPSHFRVRAFNDRFGRYTWGTYAHQVDETIQVAIEAMLQQLHQRIFIQDDLTETFALDYHTEITPAGGYKRTEIGELVYRAKPYGKTPTAFHRERAAMLAQHFVEFVQQHPTYQRANIILPIPPTPGKVFDLPTELARLIAVTCGFESVTDLVQKTRKTRPMKDCETIQEKIENVRDAFTVTSPAMVRNKSFILIDDICHTGFTMNEVGRKLLEAGATMVFGLVGTKTLRDLQE
jgi:predicted amidophosphoribosyltransferase